MNFRRSAFCLLTGLLLFPFSFPGRDSSGAGDCLFGAPPVPANLIAASSLEGVRALGNAFAAVAEKVSPAVVIITATRSFPSPEGLDSPQEDSGDTPNYYYHNPRGPSSPPHDLPMSQGSGFVVRSDGYIYTNQHVIQGADMIKVKLKDGRTFDAKVVGVPDEKTDVAVIKIEAKNLPTVELGDSDTIRPGEWTIAIGAPFNLDYSVTVGVLSGKVRDRVGALPNGYEEFLQTQATINPGNSGGPLLDIDGKVVGINTLIETRTGPGVGFYNANVGFAIPIKLAQKVATLLMTKGKVDRPWLGIDIKSLAEAPEAKGRVWGVEKGVLIMAIRPETPAYHSGLKPADVITAIDGIVVNTARDLQKQVLDKQIGQTVKLSLIREGRPISIELRTGLQPGGRPMFAKGEGTPPLPPVASLGFNAEPVTRELAEQYGLGERQGLFITDVEEDSGAAMAGLRRGMVIIEVDGKRATSMQMLKDSLKKGDRKRGVLLQLSVDKAHTFAILHPEMMGPLEN